MNTNGQTTIETSVIIDDATAAQLQQGFNESGLSKDEQDVILNAMETAAEQVAKQIEADPKLSSQQKVGKLTEAYRLIRESAVEKTKNIRTKVRYGAGTGVVYTGKGLQVTGRVVQEIGYQIERAGVGLENVGEIFRDPTKVDLKKADERMVEILTKRIEAKTKAKA